MNQMEKRQMRRVLRKFKEAEQKLFELIEECQAAGGEPFDYVQLDRDIESVKWHLDVAKEFIRATVLARTPQEDSL